MKRRTRLIFIGCATVGGTFFTTAAAQAASAAPLTDQTGVKITVQPGDTLSAIGLANSRTWEQLAAFNQVPNPDLIFVGQIITIPPADFVPAPAPSAPESDSSSSGTTTVSQVSTSSPAPDPPAPAPAPDPPAPPPAPAPAPAPSAAPSGIWGCIAMHESSGNPATNTGNGFYGLYQDTQSSWVAGGGLAYAPRADLASAAAQTIVNQNIQAQQGWGAWPVSSVACGA
ncbi:MAG: LysM peptidoglycan-binding domain-containing protein [Acidimicrobiaceae bacterium]|nr:LysM peptidoglycan-binding domain-containing protein [Acidimicrobiaceae bacterium]